MQFPRTLIATALAALVATSATAGGFAEEIVEAPVVIVEPEAPGFSIPGWVIPVVAVLAIVALANSGDDDPEDTSG